MQCPQPAGQLVAGELDDRIKALNAVVAKADTALEPFVKAQLDDTVKTSVGKAHTVADGKPVEATTGKPATLLADAEDTVANNRLRRVVESALAVLKRVSPGRAVRAAAITELKDQVDEGKLGPIDKATTTETDPELKARLQLLRAAVRISSSGPAKRPAAARPSGRQRPGQAAGSGRGAVGQPLTRRPVLAAAKAAHRTGCHGQDRHPGRAEQRAGPAGPG